MRPKLSFIVIILILFTVPLISAYNWGYGYSSPLDYLENEWIKFTVFFLVFFAIIYFALSKTFKDNKAVAAVVALGISLFISLAIAQRGLLMSYAGEELGFWILLITILLIFAFATKILYENFKIWGVILAIFILWLLLYGTEFYDFLPYGISDSPVGAFIEIFRRGATPIILIIIIIIIGILRKFFKRTEEKRRSEQFKKWTLGP